MPSSESPSRRLSRRGVITAALAASALVVLRWVTGGGREDRAADRPDPTGSSSTICAACGSGDHAMLDPRCALAPRVLG
jgi:hypothetical protein